MTKELWKYSISELLKDQLQNLMFTESKKDYIFSYIDSPYVPEKKSKPSRALICIFSTFILPRTDLLNLLFN